MTLRARLRTWLHVPSETELMQHVLAIFKRLSDIAACLSVHTRLNEELIKDFTEMKQELKEMKCRQALWLAKQDIDNLPN